MPAKIRLSRRGRKKLAIYDILVADSRAPRDGKYIEKLGTYNPNTHPATVLINEEKAVKWLLNGAEPSETTRAILSSQGLMFRKHLQVGVNKGSITQEQADAKYAAWLDEKNTKLDKASGSMKAAKDAEKKKRLEEEAKKNQARIEAIAKKNAPQEEVVVAEEQETTEAEESTESAE